MKVLVACEESQRVCTEFRKLGHEAYSCDIEPCSGGHPEWHIQGDVLKLIYPDCYICSFEPEIEDEMFGTFYLDNSGYDTEEELFIKYKYPEYDEHKKEHDDFIAYIESVNLENIDDNQKMFLKELLGKIVQWVFKHIITTDFMYKDYLLKLGMK